MPRVLLLLPGTTYRADGFLRAAQKLSLEVTVGSDGLPVSAALFPADFLALDLQSPEAATRAAVAYAKHQTIDAVIGVDDHTTVVAAAIAAALGLPYNSVASAEAARNKLRMRELLSEHGVPVPRFARHPIDKDPAVFAGTVRFPCVVKPLVLSASCGVIRANSPEEFVAAFRRVAALLTHLGLAATGGAGRDILVEDFVPGREVALEGLLTGGELRVLALFDKPDPLDGPFFEETIYVTPSRLPADLQRQIASCAAEAARALGLREGPVHGELRVNDAGVWVIELAARSIGGQCSRTLYFEAGTPGARLSLEELILRHALRMDLPDLDGPSAHDRGAAGVMMLPIPRRGTLREVRGQKEARAVPGIEELTITAQPGQELVPLPEGTRYLGFLLARGNSPEAVEAALREAHGRLEIVFGTEPPGRPDDQVRAPQRTAMRF